MTLRHKQSRFALMAAALVCRANGLEVIAERIIDACEEKTEAGDWVNSVRLEQAYRTPEMAAVYAKRKRGIVNSLHCERLALDLSLWLDGDYQRTSEAYGELHDWWDDVGGAERIARDGCHFSLAHGRRR